LVIRVEVLAKIHTRLRFVDPVNRYDAETRFTLLVTALDRPGEEAPNNEVTFRLPDKAPLPAEATPVPGRYSFAWVLGGRFGPSVELTRAELAGTEEVVLMAPFETGATVTVHVVDDEGQPVAGVELLLTYQGPGWQRVQRITDEAGHVAIPEWDAARFSVAVELSERMLAQGTLAVPLVLLNPKDGDRLTLSRSKVVNRTHVRLKGGSAAAPFRAKVHLELWGPPGISIRDWQSIARANDAMSPSSFQGADLVLSDSLGDIEFDEPEKMWFTVSAAGLQVAAIRLTEFLKHDAATPFVVDILPAGLLQTKTIAIVGKSGKWLLSPGRRTVASMLHANLRGRDDPDVLRAIHAVLVDAANPSESTCPEDTSTFTGLAADGTLVVFSVERDGSSFILHAEETYSGGTLVILAPGNAEIGQVALTASFYQSVSRTMYWDEHATAMETAQLPFRLTAPGGVPVLILPLTESYGPLRSPLNLADHTYHVVAGVDTEVALR
jgi:hypothetical protein